MYICDDPIVDICSVPINPLTAAIFALGSVVWTEGRHLIRNKPVRFSPPEVPYWADIPVQSA